MVLKVLEMLLEVVEGGRCRVIGARRCRRRGR